MRKIKFIKKSGDIVDKLTLISEEILHDGKGHSRRYWNCQCKCGSTIRRREDAFSYREHHSCGCDTSSLQSANTRRIKWKGIGQLGKTFFTACRESAKKRSIKFEITIGEAWNQFEKQNGICALSGVPIKLCGSTPIGRKEHTASIDRIDSTRGYTNDNIQWVHKTINLMKNTLGQFEFIQWCEKVTKLHYE